MKRKQYYQRSQIDPPAPVNGGLRWSDPRRDPHVRLQERSIPFDDFLAEIEVEVAEMAEEAKQRAEAQEAERTAARGPHITTTPPGEARVGGEYVYQAKAFDAMVSGFTWFLEKAPPGMAVDRHTGKVTWTPQDGGHAEIVLGARTAHGRQARQSWSVCVRKPAPARPAAANLRYREALRRRARALAAGRPAPRPGWREAAVRRSERRCRLTAPPRIARGAALPLRL